MEKKKITIKILRKHNLTIDKILNLISREYEPESKETLALLECRAELFVKSIVIKEVEEFVYKIPYNKNNMTTSKYRGIKEVSLSQRVSFKRGLNEGYKSVRFN